MTRNPRVFAAVCMTGSLILMALSIASTCSSCANSLDSARQALSAAQRVQTESIKAFERYDADTQAAIVKAATSKEQGEKSLADYRLARAKITTAILDAAAVTQAGAALIPLVQLGSKSSTDLSAWLANLLAAGVKLHDALAQFGVPFSGGAP